MQLYCGYKEALSICAKAGLGKWKAEEVLKDPALFTTFGLTTPSGKTPNRKFYKKKLHEMLGLPLPPELDPATIRRIVYERPAGTSPKKLAFEVTLQPGQRLVIES
jgi:hypothetical protein